MNVLKHNGSLEPMNLQKFRDSLQWATKDVKGVSVSDLEMQCKLHMYDCIPTSYILDVSIKTAYDMSSLRHHGYDTVARNLMLQKLYKTVFNGIHPCSLSELIARNAYHYGEAILKYSEPQLAELNKAINHSRDFTFTASGLEKTVNNDIINVAKQPIETPQFMYMLIAMDVFRDDVPRVIELYEALSTFKITFPTPELKALRTNSSDYASCCLIRMGDNADSWHEADKAILKHTLASAGIGVDIADIASVGDLVKKGTVKHSGKIKIIRSIDTHIGKASQNGRRGSATPFMNFYDPEIEDIMALKSPRTAVEKRINDLSYGIKLNQLVYDRAKANLPLSLFSVRKAPHLNDLFYGKDIKPFIAEYERLEAEGLHSGQVSARDFLKQFGTERFETSAYYTLNIDEANRHTPYDDQITQANICVEDIVPTKALDPLNPDDPAIGICVLSNLNQGLVTIEELPALTHLTVDAQTTLALRQNHPTSQANSFVSFYRDIGIGFSNHAYWLAKNGWRYGQQEALDAHDEWMEHFAYGLIMASSNLARKFGIAPGFKKTAWANGSLPINRYKRTVDELVNRELSLDWEYLRNKIEMHGMANCGLSMVPPSESSSIGSNQTSSIEPIKEPLTIKDRQGYNLKQYAPECVRLADKYDYAYDRPITQDYLKHVAVTQKWIDKTISSNVFYNPEHYEGEKVPLKNILEDMYFAKYYGCITAYYQNTKVKDAESSEPQCQGGCSV